MGTPTKQSRWPTDQTDTDSPPSSNARRTPSTATKTNSWSSAGSAPSLMTRRHQLPDRTTSTPGSRTEPSCASSSTRSCPARLRRSTRRAWLSNKWKISATSWPQLKVRSEETRQVPDRRFVRVPEHDAGLLLPLHVVVSRLQQRLRRTSHRREVGRLEQARFRRAETPRGPQRHRAADGNQQAGLPKGNDLIWNRTPNLELTNITATSSFMTSHVELTSNSDLSLSRSFSLSTFVTKTNRQPTALSHAGNSPRFVGFFLEVTLTG